MLKVLVIGTSNAIYKDGYVGGIRDHSSVLSVDRYAVGASPSVIIPYIGLSIDFSIYDIVIFDTAINDRNYYKYSSIRKDQIREFIEWGVDRCKRSNTAACLLLMPSRKAFNKETISGLIYHKIATENKLTILDGFQYVRDLCKESERNINELFIDDFHLMKPVAYNLGKEVIDLFLSSDHGSTKSNSFIAPPIFYRMDVCDFVTSTIRRTSSVTEAEFFRLEGAERLRLPVSPGDIPIGVAFNAPKSHGSLNISGVYPNIVKSLTTAYSNSSKDFQLMIMPLVSNAEAEAGFIELSISALDVKNTEGSRFEAVSLKADRLAASLEICSVVMRAGRGA